MPVAGRALINIGSGMVVAPGWINVDLGIAALVSSWPRRVQRVVYGLLPASSAAKQEFSAAEFCDRISSARFVHHEVRYGLPFGDGVAAFIYTSHFLEHLYLSDARRLLRECWRVLEPGGVLRVCVPDLTHAIELIRRGETERGLEFFFYDRGPSELTRHRYMYDAATLRRELDTAGFTNVVQRAWREGKTPDLELLDNRPEETLFVEAEKPLS